MRFITLLHRTTTTTTTVPPPPHRHQLRFLFDGNFTLVRDRGLDHAVEREKNLKPLLTLRNLIKLEPSKSLPVSAIKESIQLPFRPMDFVRKYPSIFEVFHLNGFQPHIKLTPEALKLDVEEQLMYNSDNFKHQVAIRLLKLLMISKFHKIPLRVIESLRWDLGLPHDYILKMIPEFPDYFRVVGVGFNAVLELVCWSKDHAVSVLEKKQSGSNKGNDNGLAFPLQFSTGFEMDKNYERWLRDWNKLPYVSPYENAAHLQASSDESDRWVVGVLHEILHLLVSKKTDKENILVIGEWLGLASRFKRAMLQHPGIFYMSSKNRTYTVVLREGYKRGLLVEDNPAMEFRRMYIHLMNTVKEDGSKTNKVVQEKRSAKESDNVKDCEGKEGEDERGENSEEEEERKEGSCEWSDDDSDDDSETVDEDEEEECSGDTRRNSGDKRGRNFVEMKLGVKKPFRDSGDKRGRNFVEMKLGVKKPFRDSRGERSRSDGKLRRKTWERSPSEVSKRIQTRGERKDVKSSSERTRSYKRRGGDINN